MLVKEIQQAKKIALFIDCENISYKLCAEIMKRLDEIGEVCIKKAYGDWRKDMLEPWAEVLLQYSIEPIQILSKAQVKDPTHKAKNASDIRLTIDVMHTLYQQTMDCLALATSDSDFASLAQEIRRWAIPAIGFGSHQAREELKQAFNTYEELDSRPSSEQRLTSNKALLKLLHRAIESTQDAQGFALVSTIGNWIKQNHYKSASSYDKESWGDVFKQICQENKEEFEIHYDGTRNSIMKVRLKRQ